MAFDLIIEQVEVILMTSAIFVKGAQKMLNFLVAFFLKISETLKAHMYGMEIDIKQTVFKRLSFRSFILINKKLSKISMHIHFNSHLYNYIGNLKMIMWNRFDTDNE